MISATFTRWSTCSLVVRSSSLPCPAVQKREAYFLDGLTDGACVPQELKVERAELALNLGELAPVVDGSVSHPCRRAARVDLRPRQIDSLLSPSRIAP